MSFIYKPKKKNGDLVKFSQVFDKVLISIGAWPTEGDANDFRFQLKSKLYALYGFIVLTNLAFIAICETAHSISNMTDIVKFTESSCTALMGLFATIRSLYYRLAEKKLLKLFKLFFNEIWIDAEKYPRKVHHCNRTMKPGFGYYMMMFPVLISYCIVPIYYFYNKNQTMDSKDKMLPYLMIFPYDVQKKPYYIMTYTSAAFAGFVIISFFYVYDAILLLFSSYLCAQFKILHGDIVRLIPECHAEWLQRYGINAAHYDVQPNATQIKILQEMYSRRLQNIAACHNFLISFCQELNDLLSFPLLLNIVSSTFLICVCGLQFLLKSNSSFGNFFWTLCFFLSALLQLFMICFSGSALITSSEETAYYLYMCNWEGGNLSNSSPLLQSPEDMEVASLNATLPSWKYIKYYPSGKDFRDKLRFMIMRSQRPTELNAMQFTILSVETFSKIISSSMSYFALLKTFLDEEF